MHDNSSLQAIWRSLRLALDGFIAVLLVFSIVRDFSWATAIWALCFGGIYLVGALRTSRTLLADGALPRHSNTTERIWLALLLVAWAGLAFHAESAVYLVFPLFFVILFIVSDWRGALLVVPATGVAIWAIDVHNVLTPGSVLGPILGASVAIVVSFGFFLLQRETNARAEAIDQLIAARADIAEISRRAGEQDERARVAADIHDTVAQGLSSIQLLLHSAEKELAQSSEVPATAAAHIRLARETAAENLQETRRIIDALQPATLDGSSLVQALEHVCEASPAASITRFVVDGTPTNLAPNVEAALIRVTQSALSNVVKHASATACGVTLTYSPDLVSVDIVDNGRGFDPSKIQDNWGVGISGTQRRLANLGGTLTIESQPGEGCGVTVQIPLA